MSWVLPWSEGKETPEEFDQRHELLDILYKISALHKKKDIKRNLTDDEKYNEIIDAIQNETYVESTDLLSELHSHPEEIAEYLNKSDEKNYEKWVNDVTTYVDQCAVDHNDGQVIENMSSTFLNDYWNIHNEERNLSDKVETLIDKSN